MRRGSGQTSFHPGKPGWGEERLDLLMFAWRMTRPVSPFDAFAGLPLVGLGSFAGQTSIKGNFSRSWLQIQQPKHTVYIFTVFCQEEN